MAINQISGLKPLENPFKLGENKTQEANEGADKFKQIFLDALNDANKLSLESKELTEGFAAGKYDNIHQVMIAAEKADVSLQFTLQVRNKIMDAYSEIMRMQL